MAAFRKTLSLEPKLYEAHLNLGQMLLHQKQYSEAVAELTQAAEEQRERSARNCCWAGRWRGRTKARQPSSTFARRRR